MILIAISFHGNKGKTGAGDKSQKSRSPFPRHMAHRAAPISVPIALGHASANAVKATAGGLVHW